MQRRIGDIEAWALGGEDCLEAGDIRSRRRVGHADDFHLMRAQECTEVEVARIVDQHGVAGAKQETADQVDCLRPGRRQQ
jgi:hypothetical protein